MHQVVTNREHTGQNVTNEKWSRGGGAIRVWHNNSEEFKASLTVCLLPIYRTFISYEG